MKRRDLLRHLADCGVALKREGSRHSWRVEIRSSPSGGTRHDEISNLLVLKICRELDIPPPASF